MTMKLINILNEDDDNIQSLKDMKNEIIERLNGITVPFQYGNIDFNLQNTTNVPFSHYSVLVVFDVLLNKFGPDMFDKAYLAFSEKIKSLFGNELDLEKITLRCEGIYLSLGSAIIPIGSYLPVVTINVLRYDKPTVDRILDTGYRVGVNMGLLPDIKGDTYDMIKKKEEHGKMVFEFLQDGTLNNGVSYKLNFVNDLLIHKYKESSDNHIDYSDFDIEIDVRLDKDHPLTDDEKNEIKKMFKMYDIILNII
jgi:hypothetical protein